MPSRRHTILSAAALTMTSVLPLRAVARDNPMPESLRRSLERDPNAPVLGNPNGNVTLTEFFDYNCSYCRRMMGTMQRLVSADPQLRVVFREWPVFGEGSEFASRASLASLQQGKYWAFHAGLMQMRGRAEQASVLRVAREVGLDEARLRRDMESDAVSEHISNSFMLAEHMGLMGTPTFIAGDEAAFGALSMDDLQELIERGRKVLNG
ncbi:MAG: DsbA family protein [Paracoccus sp. (in: a-proteobacteria)]|uniref:DsbA family protein n=1 Tax=Paracoccus sp. TaxID=267 RepID=UPI0026E0A399|nr:DsbA family protein [Paracoccus sp. (in: a-proteobacteria)]MDO5613660.1 DsbA family protein [Paracoccus sp. (in: a-proteobacteria)]